MAFRNRIAHLEKLHQDLDRQISQLEKSNPYNNEKIRDLKKHKLALKDEIRRLNRQAFEHDTQYVNLDDE